MAQPAHATPLLPGRVRSLLSTTVLVGAALMAGNLANYALAILGSHRLRAGEYGLFGSLLAVLAVGSVPALALQAVIARRTAAESLGVRHAVRDGLLVGGGSLAVGLLAWPGLTVFLHVGGHGVAVLAVAATLLPLGVLGAVQGHLQGSERFGGLALVLVAVGLGRFAGGVIPLLAGADPTGVLVGVGVGSLASAALALLVVRHRTGPEHLPTGDVRRPELLTATLTLGSLLLLSSLDLLLARHVLPRDLAGHYAAGSVITKAAFWLPQAIPLIALPKLSRSEHRTQAFRDAALLTGLVAAASVAFTAVAGTVFVRATFGQGYASIGHFAWLFAIEGGALAGVQLLIMDDIAKRDRGLLPIVLVAACVETAVILVAAPGDPRAIAAIAAAVAVVTVAAAAWRRSVTSRRVAAAASPRQHTAVTGGANPVAPAHR